MTASTRRLLQQLEPRVAAEVLAAFAEVRDAIDMRALERAIRIGDIDRVLALVDIDLAVFNGLQRILEDAYAMGGADLAKAVPLMVDPRTGTKVIFRFNTRDLRSERWLREYSSTLITRIAEAQRETIRGALEASLARGANPRSAALDIAGRINPLTGRRHGGMIGLTPQQAGFVRNMRAELADPSLMGNWFNRELRDRRFDGVVARALENGTGLPNSTIEKLATRYEDRLLRYRAETIARTETLTTIRSARMHSAEQLVATGRVQPQQIKKEWDATGDGRVRDSHAAMDGKRVALAEPFVLVDKKGQSHMLMYPGDTELGAGTAETVQCRCLQNYKIDFIGRVL